MGKAIFQEFLANLLRVKGKNYFSIAVGIKKSTLFFKMIVEY